MTLKLKRGNNANHYQFALSSSQFEVELSRIGFYDISAHFTSSAKLLITISSISTSCTFETTSKTTIPIPPSVTVAKYQIKNLKFYKNGIETTNDVLPFGTDFAINIDKKPVDGTSDGVVNWADIVDAPEIGGGATTLEELTDVNLNLGTLTNGQTIVWADDKWVNADVGGGGGGVVAWADVQNKPSLFPPESHVHNLTNDIVPTDNGYDETKFNLYNADLLTTVTTMTHQFIPPNCEESTWYEPISTTANYGYKNAVIRTDSYHNVPSIGFSQLRGHVSFNMSSNINFSAGVTIYMVYHKCDQNNVDDEFRLLHGAVDPSFSSEFDYPTSFTLMEGFPQVKESFQVQYTDTLGGGMSLYEFSPRFLFAEGFNTGLNILIMRYDPNTTTLSIDINGSTKKTIVHNFDQISCPYWGLCGGPGEGNSDNMPAAGWSFMTNLIEFGTAGYIDDATTATMYTTMNNYYSSLGIPDNTVATYQASDGKLHLLPVSYNNLTDVPTEFTASAHQHVIADITDFDHTHELADITDFAVETDGVTIQGDGNATALSNNSYQWKYAGTYNESLPAYQSGEFWINNVAHNLLFHKVDALGSVRTNVLASLENCSQIIIVFPNKQRNRYSISSINDNQTFYIQYAHQTDAKLTVEEEPLVNMVVGQKYQVDIVHNPIYNLDHLLDTVISNPNDGELLEYDTIVGWQNKAVPYLPLGTTNTLHQGDVVAYDSGVPQWTNSDNATIWKDLYGLVGIRSGGQANPATLQAVDSNSKFYEYATSNNGLTDFYFTFHINHDYKLGSDMYFHVHHLTNNASNANTTVIFTADVSLAQLSYTGSTNASNSKFFQESGGAVTLATISHTYDASPQYRHVVSEVQMSSNGGSANTIDSSKINIDSMILIRLRRNANSGGDNATNNYVFVLQSDLHYQFSRVGTKLRTYDTGTFSFIS